MMNWQEQLEAFRDSNPDLPQGDDSAETIASEDSLPSQPKLDIGVERKGRGGKTATLITGWILPDSELRNIASELKRRLGAGGSARGGDILIQGDRRKDVLDILTDMGYRARII